MTDEMDRREFLKRGTVAGAIATTVGLPSAALALSHDAGLPGTALAPRRLDSKEFCLSEYDAITPALSFSASDPASAARWQQQARRKVIERLGGFPSSRAPLNPEVLETTDFGSWTREKIVFDTRHNLSALGYLLLPKGAAHPLPAVV